MAISGKLSTMQVSDLLQLLANNKVSGTLVIAGGKVEKSIFFRDGAVISSASNDPTEFLGHFLVSHGFISEEELSTAIARQDTSKALLGKILVDQGSMSPDELEQMLRLKAEETIYDLFTWEEGEFSFLDDQLPQYEMVPVSMSVAKLMLEGLQRLDEWDEIHALIPSSLAVPVAVADLLDDPELDEGERSILAAVDDDRSIEEICLHTHSSEFRVCRLLRQKVEEEKLKIVRPRIAPVVQAPAATHAAGLVTEIRCHLDDGDLEGSLRLLSNASILSLDPQTGAELEDLERELRRSFLADGVTLGGIPHLRISPQELTNLDLSPQEGFILSRISGSASVSSIIKISPIAELEAMLIIWKLLKNGHIRLG